MKNSSHLNKMKETIKQMILAGMNVARLNFSHNTVEDHLRRIQIIKKVRKELGIPVAILLDTKGPEYRVGVLGKWHYLANYNYMPNNIEEIYDKLTNCKNCGAPLRAHVCEYCGTHY